jgi:cardiolipin synthase A/B
MKVQTEVQPGQISKVQLIHSGEAYFSQMLHLIRSAGNDIHLHAYILENDATGREILGALTEAARRQVEVYILLDSYGSGKLSADFFAEMAKEGLHVRLFSPWYSKNIRYLGRRLHHKVLVIDGATALIGGINISDKYRGTKLTEPWLDFAVRVDGSAVAEPLRHLCQNMYLNKSLKKGPVMQAEIHDRAGASVRILRNDWFKQRKDIYNGYLQAIAEAQDEIILVASYFLPGRKIMQALRLASRRSVRVRIVLSGVSDLPLVMRATQYLYDLFLRHGMELYEWKKSVLHGKLAIVDQKWVTVGSFNLNGLSYYGNIEMNTVIESSAFAEEIRPSIISIIQDCEQIQADTLKTQRGIFTRFHNWIAWRLVRLALRIVALFAFTRKE